MQHWKSSCLSKWANFCSFPPDLQQMNFFLLRYCGRQSPTYTSPESVTACCSFLLWKLSSYSSDTRNLFSKMETSTSRLKTLLRKCYGSNEYFRSCANMSVHFIFKENSLKRFPIGIVWRWTDFLWSILYANRIFDLFSYKCETYYSKTRHRRHTVLTLI